jgi:2-oxoisovalerate dehydrogenase E1 component
MASTISELCFDYLDAPAVVVVSKKLDYASCDYEKSFFPQPSWILDAIHQKIVPLKGHVAKNEFSQMGKQSD